MSQTEYPAQHVTCEVCVIPILSHFRNLQKVRNPGSLRVTLVLICVWTFLELKSLS